MIVGAVGNRDPLHGLGRGVGIHRLGGWAPERIEGENRGDESDEAEQEALAAFR